MFQWVSGKVMLNFTYQSGMYVDFNGRPLECTEKYVIFLYIRTFLKNHASDLFKNLLVARHNHQLTITYLADSLRIAYLCFILNKIYSLGANGWNPRKDRCDLLTCMEL